MKPSLSQMGDVLCRNLDKVSEGVEVLPPSLYVAICYKPLRDSIHPAGRHEGACMKVTREAVCSFALKFPIGPQQQHTPPEPRLRQGKLPLLHGGLWGGSLSAVKEGSGVNPNTLHSGRWASLDPARPDSHDHNTSIGSGWLCGLKAPS